MKKIKVLIVDDEILAVDFLKNLIEWEAWGYIVFGASSAGMALELFKKERPEIVISDICMPGTDGLDLCLELRRLEPSVKLILLTAYKEFDYAKTAIEVGVNEYLIKHELTAPVLLDKLGSLRETIEKECTDKQLNRHRVLRACTLGIEAEEAYDYNLKAEIDSDKRAFIMFFFGDMENIEYKNQDREPVLSGSDLIYVADFKVTRGIFVVLMEIGRAQLLLRPEQIKAAAAQLFFWCAGKPMDKEICIIEKNTKKMENLEKMYTKCVKFHQYAALLGLKNPVYEIGFAENAILERKGCYAEINRQMAPLWEHLSRNEFQKAREILYTIYYERLPERGTILDVHYCNQSIIHMICSMEKKNPADQEWDGEELKAGLEALKSLEEYYSYFRSCLQLIGKPREKRGGRESEKIREVITYIHKNYGKDIGIPEIARQIGVSESYLIKEFKRSMGCTVHDYLVDVRIHMARELLTRETKKIYEIAELTGFNSSQYFSIVFLKQTGMTPKQYRQFYSEKK